MVRSLRRGVIVWALTEGHFVTSVFTKRELAEGAKSKSERVRQAVLTLLPAEPRTELVITAAGKRAMKAQGGTKAGGKGRRGAEAQRVSVGQERRAGTGAKKKATKDGGGA